MKKLFTVLAFASATFISCSKEKDDTTEPVIYGGGTKTTPASNYVNKDDWKFISGGNNGCINNCTYTVDLNYMNSDSVTVLVKTDASTHAAIRPVVGQTHRFREGANQNKPLGYSTTMVLVDSIINYKKGNADWVRLKNAQQSTWTLLNSTISMPLKEYKTYKNLVKGSYFILTR